MQNNRLTFMERLSERLTSVEAILKKLDPIESTIRKTTRPPFQNEAFLF